MVVRYSIICIYAVIFLLLASPFLSSAAENKLPKKNLDKKVSSVSSEELNLLKKLDAGYQKQSISMTVDKITRIPLLDQERKSTGRLLISAGRLRMEMQGNDKTLLVVNKQNLWAVTFPAPEFKDGPLQVIQTNTSTKKGRSQGFVTLLSQGGFLKFFIATGAQKDDKGNVLFFLSPKEEQVDFKRAQIKVSGDGKKMLAISYWDDRDNETRMEFSDIKSEAKLSNDLFNYTPPAGAEILKI